MAESNYYLTVPNIINSSATEDGSNVEDPEALGFVVVEHEYCSNTSLETENVKLYEAPNYDFERAFRFQRKDNTELNIIYNGNEQIEREGLFAVKEKVEQETLKSLGRSLRLLQESEEAASSTTQELLRQREQLEYTERKLDEVHGKLTENKKVIRNLQGVLGGVKNYVVKKCRSRTPSPNKRTDAGDRSPRPKSSIVSLNSSVQKEAACPAKNHTGVEIRVLHLDSRDATDCTTKSSNMDEIVERRLSDISSSIHRLQDFAVNLNAELRSENELIDRLIVKTEGANIKVVAQTEEVAKLKKELRWF